MVLEDTTLFNKSGFWPQISSCSRRTLGRHGYLRRPRMENGSWSSRSIALVSSTSGGKRKISFFIRCCTADMRLPMKRGDYDHVWHLVIPPVMTLLDDYESYYKLKGLIMVSELLKHVPPETLKRTGIDGLLISVRQLAVRCCLPSLKEHQSP